MQPVINGQFSFNVDTFYVAASGGQIHRRAAPAEIKALYDTSTVDKSSAPDHPGHWCEAQLLHYGLPPSKVKATAKMRLLKALQDGGLSVPKENSQIEKNLKKEWKKQDVEEQPQTNSKTTTTKTVTTKKTTVTKTVASKTTETKAAVSKTAAKPAPTKAAAKSAAPKGAPKKETAPKATASKAVPANTTTIRPGAQTTVKPSAAKTTAPKAATTKKTTAPKAATPKATTVQTATPKVATAKRKRAATEESLNQPQTAKRRANGGKTTQQSDVPSKSHTGPSGWSEQPEYQDAPPSYEEACRMNGEYHYNALDDQMDIDSASIGGSYDHDSPQTLKRTLGLLNGTYEIRSPDIEEQWPDYMPSGGISLSLRLNGTEMWGTYDFGMFTGVLWIPQRPMKPSFEGLSFYWRGRESGTGEMSFGASNEGWIEFLGDGDIVGMINCCGDLNFRGHRVNNYVRTAQDLRDEWDGYNESEYEQENRSRWH